MPDLLPPPFYRRFIAWNYFADRTLEFPASPIRQPHDIFHVEANVVLSPDQISNPGIDPRRAGKPANSET